MRNVFICILSLRIHTQFVFIDFLSIYFIFYFVSSYQLKKENFHFHLCKPTNTNYANCSFFKNFEKSLHITIIGYIVFCQVVKLQCGFSFSNLKRHSISLFTLTLFLLLSFLKCHIEWNDPYPFMSIIRNDKTMESLFIPNCNVYHIYSSKNFAIKVV